MTNVKINRKGKKLTNEVSAIKMAENFRNSMKIEENIQNLKYLKHTI